MKDEWDRGTDYNIIRRDIHHFYDKISRNTTTWAFDKKTDFLD